MGPVWTIRSGPCSIVTSPGTGSIPSPLTCRDTGVQGASRCHSIETSARWLLEFIDTLGIEKTALVGHSMGALVALEAAFQAQARISNVVLLGAAVPMVVADPLLNAARANNHSAVDMIMLYSHAYTSQLGGNPVAGINILNSNMRLLERSLGKRILYADLKACNEYDNGIEAARNISAPVTLVLGEDDRMTPPALAADLINALTEVQVGDPAGLRPHDAVRTTGSRPQYTGPHIAPARISHQVMR